MRKILPGLIIFSLLQACESDSDLLDRLVPSATINLTFPEHLSTCTEGTSISETESEVPFSWEALENISTYKVHVTDLRTNEENVWESTENTLIISLMKGTPYSWYVTSVANPDKVRSENSIFYNAGPGLESFVPYPATAVSPVTGASISVTSTTVNLTWNASDEDDDIIGFDLYFGETDNPAIFEEDIEESRYFEIPVSAGQTYYWKVVTKDSAGHESTSPVFAFTVG